MQVGIVSIRYHEFKVLLRLQEGLTKEEISK